MKKGFVYLAGSGPGDYELITLKTMRVLSEADCVIYDFLANPEFVENLECEKIYVGKSGSNHTLSQDDITDLVVKKALEGKVVVRLKGGDPFIFGRGGEEAEACVEAGVPFEIVPGISSFYSAPAYAGIPLTHRDFSNAFEVITGHRRADSSDGEDVNFPEYNPEKTYAFLMGVKNLDHISESLISEKNFPDDTPVAVISWGTHPKQRVATGTLSNIADVVKSEKISPPAIIIMGGVVTLRDKLRWFDSLPLFGKKIVVTRTRKQASKLSEKLKRYGAEVIEFPTIVIERGPETNFLKDKINELNTYKWIVFTSQNAVNIFFDTMKEMKLDTRSLGNAKIAVIGSATGDELGKYGIVPDIVPEKFVAESLLESFKDEDLKDVKILLPCSEQARLTLKEGLESMGAVVDRVHIYRAEKPDYTGSGILERINDADIVTFTSSSTALNFFSLVNETNAVKASIGPITSKTIKELGHSVDLEAEDYTVDGLVEAMIRFYEE